MMIIKLRKSFICAALALLLAYPNKTSATWSIIIIDQKTHEIGIAGASCTHNCYGIGRIIPNTGAIIVQAMSNNQARKKGAEMIVAESTPEQIIRALRSPEFNPEKQQYAVVTIKHINAPATYTGDSTPHFNGALTRSGVSVQGNILASDDELRTIMEAVEKGQRASLNIADILMMALEAGGTSGGDKRCGEQKAASSFITVATPTDKEPYLNLNIIGQENGGHNAVVMLRDEFEEWKKTHQLYGH